MIRRRTAGVTVLAALPGLVALSVLPACAETTVDPESTAAVTAPPSTGRTGAPTETIEPLDGTPAELASQLVSQARGLSDFIVEGAGDDEALAEIDATWAALRPVIAAEYEGLLIDFDAAINLVNTAVERRRPADADKASNNLATLVAAAGLR